MHAVARWLPAVAARVPWVALGTWPTPLSRLALDGRDLWIKHEGDSASEYGGNKVRTLEAWFGHARARGARRIWAIGAYGSNHAIATLVHAPRAELAAGALVFPQPTSEWAVENCGAMLASGAPITRMRSVVELPFRGIALARRDRDSVVMPPGGATPIGTFGALNAAFELAAQITDGVAPAPRRIVLPIGSTCTTAGLLAGLHLARAAGAWPWKLPIVHGVRVTPWPVTSKLLILQLARATVARAVRIGMPDIAGGVRALAAHLVVDGRELGPGYGKPTARSAAASRVFTDATSPDGSAVAPRLDGVYSAKAAAALLRLHEQRIEPLLFWATKSSTVLAAPLLDQLAHAPRALVTWLAR